MVASVGSVVFKLTGEQYHLTMPKSSYCKKRKRDNKKDGGSEAKKSKISENVSVTDHECDPAYKLPATEIGKGFEKIDEILEETATRNNLTAINVKSILHVSYVDI